MKTFLAQIDKAIGNIEADLAYVASMGIQDVLEAAQTPQRGITKGASGFVEGKIPVAEGELIKSLTTEGVSGEASYTVAISKFTIGDVMEFEWTAAHALRMELGFTGTDALGRYYEQPGRHYVGANAARFDEFIGNRTREVS